MKNKKNDLKKYQFICCCQTCLIEFHNEMKIIKTFFSFGLFYQFDKSLFYKIEKEREGGKKLWLLVSGRELNEIGYKLFNVEQNSFNYRLIDMYNY